MLWFDEKSISSRRSFRKLQVCWFLSRHHILQRLGPNELLFFYSLFPIKSAISILIKIWPIWQNFKAKIRNFSDLPIKSSQQIFLSLYFNWRYVEEEEDCNCTSLPEKEKNKIKIEKTVVGEFLHIIRHFSLWYSLSLLRLFYCAMHYIHAINTTI